MAAFAAFLLGLGTATAQQQPEQAPTIPAGEEINITAPQADTAAPQPSPAIPRQAPGDGAEPIVVQEQVTTNPPALAPGEIETTVKPNLPARALTKEELDAIRSGMVDQTEGLILRPNEVGRIRDATLGSKSASVRPTYSGDPFPTALPRVVQASKTPYNEPPIARLAYGMTTPVTFVDSNGFPWPIANVTYNPSMVAQDGAGCGNSGAAQTPDGTRPTTINLTPCYFEVFSNVNVALQNFPYPVVLMAQSGFRPTKQGSAVSIDLPLTVVVDGRSPLAEKVKPVAIRKQTSRRKVASKRPRKVVTGDDDLAAYIVGRPPADAQSVSLVGAPDVRGYIAGNGDLVVVGYADVAAPGFAARAQTPDGEKAFRFRGAPFRLVIVDRSGAEFPATVRY